MPEQNYSSKTPVTGTEGSVTIPLIIGRLVSLFVHETNNHLATVSETTGLGGDIISAHNLSDKEKLKELEKLLINMDDRLGHATSLVRTLGSVGRHMENPSVPTDIKHTVEEIMPFLSKIARQKNLIVRTSFDRQLSTVVGNGSALQCLILALFDNFCSELLHRATTTITISSDRSISSVVIRFTADSIAPADSELPPWSWKALETFAATYNFGVSRQAQGGAVTLTIRND